MTTLKVRQHFIEQVIAYLAISANIDKGRTVEEITDNTGISRATVYRLVRDVGKTFGIYQANNPSWPASYYVVPEVVAQQQKLLATGRPVINPTEKIARDSFDKVFSAISSNNLLKLHDTLGDPETKMDDLISQLITQLDRGPNPAILAPLSIVLQNYISRML